MNTVEQRVVKQCIADLLDAGFSITVDDGDSSDLIKNSRDPEAIIKEMGSMCEDILYAQEARDKRPAMVLFVYGNMPWEVIADYSISLEKHLTRTNALIDELEAQA